MQVLESNFDKTGGSRVLLLSMKLFQQYTACAQLIVCKKKKKIAIRYLFSYFLFLVLCCNVALSNSKLLKKISLACVCDVHSYLYNMRSKIVFVICISCTLRPTEVTRYLTSFRLTILYNAQSIFCMLFGSPFLCIYIPIWTSSSLNNW